MTNLHGLGEGGEWRLWWLDPQDVLYSNKGVIFLLKVVRLCDFEFVVGDLGWTSWQRERSVIL